MSFDFQITNPRLTLTGNKGITYIYMFSISDYIRLIPHLHVWHSLWIIYFFVEVWQLFELL